MWISKKSHNHIMQVLSEYEKEYGDLIAFFGPSPEGKLLPQHIIDTVLSLGSEYKKRTEEYLRKVDAAVKDPNFMTTRKLLPEEVTSVKQAAEQLSNSDGPHRECAKMYLSLIRTLLED